ncbi:SDR family NAD(P)-dependent oxidoreductase, partial [Frankia sp. Cj3]|uniref:SDR family NAD(P)-dependent oxidoreductase n=1 Tax=Frankia sp. Cj3 TaxID=2880976 RepID=UPI001EF6B1D7
GPAAAPAGQRAQPAVSPAVSPAASPAAPAPGEARRLTAQTWRLPAIDRLEGAYAAAPVAVVLDHGDELAAPIVRELERRGWDVCHRTLGSPATSAGDAFLDWDGQDLDRQLAEVLAESPRIDLCLTLLGQPERWDDATRRLAETVRAAGRIAGALRETADTGTRASFVTVSRLDGILGHSGERAMAAAVLGGATGLVKTLAREMPALFCRALDLSPALGDDAAAEAVLRELDDAARDVAEVGVDAERQRWTVRYEDLDLVPVDLTDLSVGTEDTLVVTGGARGVTALCVRALAQVCPLAFLLLGRTELTDEPDWAAGVPDSALKPKLIERLRADGGSPAPREVNRALRDLLAQREIRATLADVTAAGARAAYLSVDVADATATRAALAEHEARITGIVHGAGALADAMLVDKSAADVRGVLAPKIIGLGNVLAAVPQAPLRQLVVFTSIAGIAGNPGQGDYAAANEALNKVTASWRRSRPASAAVAINWGAWDGGMVTPELREMFRARGVPLLAPADGARMFVEQFSAARAGDACVLVGHPVPLAAATGPIDTPAFVSHRELTGFDLDPVVDAHQIGAHPVLPATAGLGWLINGLERANRDLRVVEARDFEVHKGIVFDGSHERGYRLEADAGSVVDGRLVIRAAIRSDTGGAFPASHYGGVFVLAASPDQAPADVAWPGYPLGQGPENGLDGYADGTLFHGVLLQGIRRLLHQDRTRLVVECRLPDTPLAAGAFAGSLHSPALGDVVVQAAYVLGRAYLRAGCLPLGIGRVQFFAPLPGNATFVAVADNLRSTSMGVTVDVTVHAPDGAVLQRFLDVSLISTPDMAEKIREGARRRDARARP